MSESRPKPSWVDYTNLASNVAQNVQLSEVQSALKTLGALQAEKVRLELSEQHAREREDQLREHIWQMGQAFQRFVPGAAPCAICVVARQIQDSMSRYRISVASFREFADKDRFGQFVGRLQRAEDEAINKMTAAQRAEWETYVRYKDEAQELDDLINRVQAELERNAQQIRRLSKVRVQKEAATEELRKLSGPSGQSNRLKGAAWSTDSVMLARVAGSLLFGTGLLAAILGIGGLSLGHVLAGTALMLSCPVCFALAYYLQQKAARHEHIAALEQTVKRAESEIVELASVVPLTDGDPIAGYALEASGGTKGSIASQLKKFQANTVAGLLQTRTERQAFMEKIRHANGLTDDDSFQEVSSQASRASTISALSPEVQDMARHAHKKISAIMLHQKQTGASLAEAKEAVETYMVGKNESV